jgi:protein SCO1/2
MRWSALVLAALAIAACGRAAPAFPEFSLTDQSGRQVRLDDFRGRALVVSFVFTTCVEACPIVTAQLARVQARAGAEGLGDRVRFLSITVDPLTDTPAVLARYASGYGVDLRTWHFLTGPPDDVARLTRALEVGVGPGKRGLAHDIPVIFVDPRGRIASRSTDIEMSPDTALATLKALVGVRL